MAWSLFSSGVSPKSWAVSVLQSGGWPQTTANIQSLIAWAVQEGGGGQFNPLNTTQGNGSNFNSVGVKNFGSWQDGVNATVATINNGNFPHVVAMLKSGQGIGASSDLSTWSGGGYNSLQTGWSKAGGYLNGQTAPLPAGNVNATLTSSNTNPGLLSLLTSPLQAIPQGLSQGFAGAFGAANFKDLAIRAGLLILGGILVVVGIIIMSGREIKAATNIIGVPLGPGAAVGTSIAKSRTAAMAEAKQRANETARQRRLAEAASRPRVSHTTRESHVYHHTVKAGEEDAS